MPTAPDLCPSGLDGLPDCQRGQDAFNNVSNTGKHVTARTGNIRQEGMSRDRLRPCRSSLLQPSRNTSGYAKIRQAKSGEALQATEPSTSLECPVLVRDGHYALSTIQDLQPTQKLLILTPSEFLKSSSDTFQKALLSNYLIPPIVFQLPYGNTQINPHAEAAIRSAAQTIIFINNADSDQMILIKRTTDIQPLLIMIGPPFKRYFDFMENLGKKGSPPSSVLALVAASAQGLQNTARLIRGTATHKEG